MAGMLLLGCSNEAGTPGAGNVDVAGNASSASAGISGQNQADPTIVGDTAAASQSNPALPADKIDDSVRASYELPSGQLVVKPNTAARVSALGVPSCMGFNTDLKWTGDYEAVEVDKKGKTQYVLTFPDDFAIVQQKAQPMQLQHLKLGDTDVLVYTPRYTDCHFVETYFSAWETIAHFRCRL